MRETQLLTLFLQRLRILMQSSHTRDSDVNESGSANKKEAKAREKHAKEKEEQNERLISAVVQTVSTRHRRQQTQQNAHLNCSRRFRRCRDSALLEQLLHH